MKYCKIFNRINGLRRGTIQSIIHPSGRSPWRHSFARRPAAATGPGARTDPKASHCDGKRPVHHVFKVFEPVCGTARIWRRPGDLRLPQNKPTFLDYCRRLCGLPKPSPRPALPLPRRSRPGCFVREGNPFCPLRCCCCRQTNSFIENSIAAGILLGGNGVIHAMAIARALVLVQSIPGTN
jgi:hypothetical protein